MRARTSSVSFFSAALFIALLAGSTPVSSQCTATAGMLMTGSTASMEYIYIQKMLNMAYSCVELMRNGVRGCFPDTSATVTSYLSADAYTTATNPSCSWRCACATQNVTFRIDGTDGLPVELMDFSIDE